MALRKRMETAVLYETFLFDNGRYYAVNKLKYHNSYDWLMPVVEKIESTGQGYKFQICRKRVVVIEDWGQQLDVVKVKAGSKIEAVWLAVVEFIKHHKNQR